MKNLDTTSQQTVLALGRAIRGEVCADIFNRIAFSTDASMYQIIPQCVVRPADINDIVISVNFARENEMSLVARGAGSGLAGESLGSGIVLDTTRFMNKILSVSPDYSTVTVQPGMVLDDLNNYLSRFGKKIGPDPSSSNRAVIGGVVANNSTGSHSLQFGYIAGHIESILAVLYDGSIVRLENNIRPQDIANPTLKKIAAELLAVFEENRQIIESARRAAPRDRCGYNIRGIFRDGKIDLAKLMASSEGTLAIFAEITLRTVDIPKTKTLLLLEFENLDRMAESAPIIASCGAAACELMDQRLVRSARAAFPHYDKFLPSDNAAASLLVEHTGNSDAEVNEKIRRTLTQIKDLQQSSRIVSDEAEQKALWKARKDAVPLSNRRKGFKRPIAFIEDVAVENSRLAEYIAGLRQIGQKYGVDMTYYGHAGDGELHVRPFLDLSDPQDIQKMKDIAAEAFALAWKLGGTISGEHADGLVHAAFIKSQYGDEYYNVLKKVKQIFDPPGVFNPGKIISDDADVFTKNLRANAAILQDRLQSALLFDKNEYLFELMQCDGCGLCRGTQDNLRMCPVFRADPHELNCSRAKANLIAAWARGLLSDEDIQSEQFRGIIAKCVNCGMCAVQCPSGVDVSKLIAAVRTELARRKGLNITQNALAKNRLLSVAGSAFAPLSNIATAVAPVKFAMEKTLGLDRRRAMPAFKRGSFVKKAQKWLSRRSSIAKPVAKAVYFADSYANYNDHELGFDAIKILRHLGVDVVVPKQRPVPMPAIVYGDFKTAQKEFRYIVKNTADYVRAGFCVICSEPSAVVGLKHDLRLYVPGTDAAAIADNVFELMSYAGELMVKKPPKIKDLLAGEVFAYHAPCHLLTLTDARPSVEILRRFTSAKVIDISGGCCGIAGTFGMQKKNYDLSVKIGRSLCEAINKSDAQIILTECATCKMQIEHLTGKTVVHPAKILARAIGI